VTNHMSLMLSIIKYMEFYVGLKYYIFPFLFSTFLTEHHAMKAYMGSGVIAPRILWPRHYMEVSGQLHALAALPPVRVPLVPIG
jgi:hypothetical protein